MQTLEDVYKRVNASVDYTRETYDNLVIGLWKSCTNHIDVTWLRLDTVVDVCLGMGDSDAVTKYEVVELLRDRIEERRRQLGLDPQAFVEATGLTRGGLDPLRKGYRKQYQERLTIPVCRVLGWTPDSIDRLLRGEEPVLLVSQQRDRDPVVEELVRLKDASTAQMQELTERVLRLEAHVADLLAAHRERLG